MPGERVTTHHRREDGYRRRARAPFVWRGARRVAHEPSWRRESRRRQRNHRVWLDPKSVKRPDAYRLLNTYSPEPTSNTA
jgi:hypothetical protein